MSSPSTLGETLERAASRLEAAGVPSPRHEARWLLAALLETDSGGLLAARQDPIDPEAERRYRDWIERRASRVPPQHLTGRCEFYGLDFAVDGRVLIPRPETEGLVDAVLSLAPEGERRVLDVGTGSGCIAIALAAQRPTWTLTALDRSAEALEVARQNGARHGVQARLRWVEGDLARLPGDWRGRFDIVVSNPPYVAEDAWRGLDPEVRDHDPRVALVPGPTGLEAYAALAPAARDVLREGGSLVLELGYGQADAVRALVDGAGLRTEKILDDLQGIPRVLVARRDEGRDR